MNSTVNSDPACNATLGTATIILAEDDAVMRAFVTESLERDGFKVLSFDSGDALSAWFDTLSIGEQPLHGGQILVSDIFMPGASAFELLERYSSILGSFRVILITGFGTENLHEKASRLGANAVIDKPFDMKDLKSAIEYQLQTFQP